MDLYLPSADDPSTTWDFGDLLDFTVDDHFPLSFDSDHLPPPLSEPETSIPLQTDTPDRIRKRDPRLTCENFLAGRIPCACPEEDERLEEEEDNSGNKRPRTARAVAGIARCQVPGCEIDISELKGYHRRHRVCLGCANAGAVVLDGQSKRYCQQCGKFHILSDFDEGKRSCRRKLERHNKRRRRRSIGSKGSVEKEPPGDLLADNVSCDVEAGKDSLCLSNQMAEGAVVESEVGHVLTPCSAPGLQNIHSNNVTSILTSDETHKDGQKGNPEHALSSYCENKSAYSSTCPTGRISFKLYDWNPAEFPRRLRHQIFEWLANMPVELEGYVRPGCTILTSFIAMPTFMWMKLLEDPASYIHDFIIVPGKLLSGRGTVLVNLNNMIFRVSKDSVMKVNMEVRAPRLHYVYPYCFEAGKPIEFVACGSNLIQPKFRFLVSFAGKYLEHDYSVAFAKTEGVTAFSFNRQLYKICVACTEPNLLGPAFIEVENESGLSNFIPILIGDKDACSEVMRFDASLHSKGSQFSKTCQDSVPGQRASSQFILDIAWLLKETRSEESTRSILTSSQIHRYNSLLNFLVCHDFITILDKVLQSLKILMDNLELNGTVNGVNDGDMRLFEKNVNHARDVLCWKLEKSRDSVVQLQYSEMPSIGHVSSQKLQDKEMGANGKSKVMGESECVPLLGGEVVMNVMHIKELPRKSCHRIFATTKRSAMFVIATAAVCFGVCVVFLHPNKVGEFAVTVRRCLFDKF